MLSLLYNKFFAKDKPLRHYTQHLLVALGGYLLLPIFNLEYQKSTFYLFILASYIVDLDGLISVFIFREKIKEAGQIVEALKSLKLMESATLGTMHHKRLNRLVVHNVIGLTILVVILVWSILAGSEALIISTWAILCHFTFDIVDDVYQLGHIRNWLWPVSFISKPGPRSL